MKTKILKFRKASLICFLAVLFAINFQVNAQPTGHWILGGNANTPPIDNVAFPGKNFLGIRASIFPPVNATPLKIGTGGISSIYVDAVLGAHPHFVGIGAGFLTPNYLLDVKGGDIDVATTTDGYRLGGITPNWGYVLRNNGEFHSIWVGIGAGNSGSTGFFNTFVGWYTGNANSTGIFNVFVGSQAGRYNSSGNYNCFLGSSAGENNIGGENVFVGDFAGENNKNDSNVYVGYNAGKGNTIGHANTFVGPEAGTLAKTGWGNTFVGDRAGYHCSIGDFNTCVGRVCGFNLTSGNYNCFYGKHCGTATTTGGSNCMFGFHCGQLSNGDENVYMGNDAAFLEKTGYFNVMIGGETAPLETGYENVYIGGRTCISSKTGIDNVLIGYGGAATFVNGKNNTLLGAFANFVNVNPSVNNRAAIGANVITAADNQMELGDNNTTVTMGMSAFAPTATTRLELNTEHGAAPFNITSTTPSPVMVNGQGWSGLRFDDLTSNSAQSTPLPGSGVLSLDTNGDVVYVSQSGTGIGAGYCPTPTILTGDAGYDLNNVANFYYAGIGASAKVNNVIIGNTCGYAPKAKLDVLQSTTGSFNTIGIYARNNDVALTTSTPIGIVSYMPPVISPSAPSIAGYFDAHDSLLNSYLTNKMYNYSIFVPPGNGAGNQNNFLTGVVSVGYGFGKTPVFSTPPASGVPYLIFADGGISAFTYGTLSDRRFKQDFTPLTNAISKIGKIHPYYFYYDTVKYAKYDFPITKQVGFVAQNVDSVLPEVVTPSDSGYMMDYPKMTVLLLAGMQQQQAEIDSLKNQIQQCCNNRDHKADKQGNDNEDSSNNNVQNVTLANSAMLYQNAPNPFGEGGTKINYFLPQNTMGASIVFYDMYGNMLKTVQLTQTGMGTININPESLSNGVYSYTLVINGNAVDTKKMVFQK